MTEEKQFDKSFAEWQKGSAFVPHWSYSYVNNSQYYASIPAPYNVFMRRFVQHSLFWADGWNPFFHNAQAGIFSTGLGGAICKRLADKVYGGKVYFKNVSMVDDDIDLDHIDEVKPNESILTLLDWAEEVDFYGAVAKSIDYALRGGTSFLKLNKNRHGKVWVEALRFDQAYPCVNGDGSIERLTSMILANIPYDKENTNDSTTSYVLQEERYFGDYTRVDGSVEEDVPLVEYKVHKLSGEIANGIAKSNECVRWDDLPKPIKKAIKGNCPSLMIDNPIRLPFPDLGVFMVKATDGIPSLPMLPFGEPILHKIIPHLQAFDYAFSAQCTDMYIGRGRVLMPKGIANATDGGQYSGMDSLLFEKTDYVNPDEQKPLPIQFEIRSEEWRAKFDSILNLIALNIGVSNITLASFLQDNSAAKTAREVSQQENETMQFVQTTRAVMEKPINKLLNEVRLYMGLKDKIAIRWSNASLENPYINAETLSMAVQGGFISKWKAIQRFNVDDNDVQLATEYKRIMKDQENSSFGNQEYSDDENMDYFSQMGGQTIPRDEWEKQFGEQKDGLVYDNKESQSPSDNS